jgi:hypothetical protein
MSDQDSTRSTFTRSIELAAYLIDEPFLKGVDTFVRESCSGLSDGSKPLSLSCMVQTTDDGSCTFNSIDELLSHFARSRELIRELRLDYRAERGERIEITFPPQKVVDFSAYGDSPKFHFLADGLARELRRSDANFHWLARTLAFSRVPRRILASLIPLVSWLLLLAVGYYFHAKKVGVDVDPKLLYDDNTYYQDVERAIKSESTDEKLNILLRGELKNFRNVTVVIGQIKRQIAVLSIALLLIAAGLLAIRSISSAYPRSFFAIGHGVERLRKLERKREIWIVGVVIAFIINLAAGLLVAFAL